MSVRYTSTWAPATGTAVPSLPTSFTVPRSCPVWANATPALTARIVRVKIERLRKRRMVTPPNVALYGRQRYDAGFNLLVVVLGQLKGKQRANACQAYGIGSRTPASAKARSLKAHESQRPHARSPA